MFKIILKDSGKHFDPEVVNAFITTLKLKYARKQAEKAFRARGIPVNP